MKTDDGSLPVAGLGVSTAVRRRQSVRAFLPAPVERSVVQDIIDSARFAPSNGNLQPWRLHVVSGDMLREIESRVSTRFAQGLAREGPPVDVYPRGLWEPFKSRRHDAGVKRYAAMGFLDKDPAGLARLTTMNIAFFGAPIGLFFCLSERMTRHQWCDLGMFMQTMMLLAVERGLDTCPQAYWTNWSEVLRDVLKIDGDTVVVAGMALGYRDPSHPINDYRTDRAGLDAFTEFHGL